MNNKLWKFTQFSFILQLLIFSGLKAEERNILPFSKVSLIDSEEPNCLPLNTNCIAQQSILFPSSSINNCCSYDNNGEILESICRFQTNKCEPKIRIGSSENCMFDFECEGFPNASCNFDIEYLLQGKFIRKCGEVKQKCQPELCFQNLKSESLKANIPTIILEELNCCPNNFCFEDKCLQKLKIDEKCEKEISNQCQDGAKCEEFNGEYYCLPITNKNYCTKENESCELFDDGDFNPQCCDITHSCIPDQSNNTLNGKCIKKKDIHQDCVFERDCNRGTHCINKICSKCELNNANCSKDGSKCCDSKFNCLFDKATNHWKCLQNEPPLHQIFQFKRINQNQSSLLNISNTPSPTVSNDNSTLQIKTGDSLYSKIYSNFIKTKTKTLLKSRTKEDCESPGKACNPNGKKEIRFLKNQHFSNILVEKNKIKSKSKFPFEFLQLSSSTKEGKCCKGLKCLMNPYGIAKQNICMKDLQQPCARNKYYCEDPDLPCCRGLKCCSNKCMEFEDCKACVEQNESCAPNGKKKCCHVKDKEINCISDAMGENFKCLENRQPFIEKGGRCDNHKMKCHEPNVCLWTNHYYSTCQNPVGLIWSTCNANKDCQGQLSCVNGRCTAIECKTLFMSCRKEEKDCCPKYKCIEMQCVRKKDKKKAEKSKDKPDEKLSFRFKKSLSSLSHFINFSQIENYENCAKEDEICVFKEYKRKCCNQLKCLWSQSLSLWKCKKNQDLLENLLEFYTHKLKSFSNLKKDDKINGSYCVNLNENCQNNGISTECCDDHICIPEFPNGIAKCKSQDSFHFKILQNPTTFNDICISNFQPCDPSLEEKTFCCDGMSICAGDSEHGFKCSPLNSCVSESFANCDYKPCCGDLKCLQSISGEIKQCFPEATSGSHCLSDEYCHTNDSSLECLSFVCVSKERKCGINNDRCSELANHCCPGFLCSVDQNYQVNSDSLDLQTNTFCKKNHGFKCNLKEECLEDCNKYTKTCVPY